MPRGFLAGVVSGGLAGALGLAGISLVLPPPKATVPEAVSLPASPAEGPAELAGGEVSSAQAAAEVGAEVGAAAQASGAASDVTEVPAPEAPVAAEPSEAAVDTVPQEVPEVVASDDPQEAAGAATAAPSDDAAAESDAASPDSASAQAGQSASALAEPSQQTADPAEIVPADGMPAAQPMPEGDATARAALPQSSDPSAAAQDTPLGAEPGTDASDAAQAKTESEAPAETPEPEGDATGQVAAPPDADLPQTSGAEAGLPGEESASGRPRLLQPAPSLSDAAEGVTRNRLPSIGSAPAAILDDTQPLADAMTRNARSFANPSGRPPFAVLLLDDGAIATADLATVAASKLPLTLVVDPAAAEAPERAALWRAAGQEVALLAGGIAAGAKGSDGEIAVEAMVKAIPQALALVAPTAESALQSDRMAAAAVVPALAARGFGLVTWDQGLNAADQVARREGLAAATIYRDLSGRDDSGPVMTRALDRAAFKAQQDGRALVFGRLDPATIEALMSWSLSARAASLTPAPLSAVLK